MFPGRYTVKINKVCIGLRGDEQFACLCWLLMKSIVAWGQSVLLHQTNLRTMGLTTQERRLVEHPRFDSARFHPLSALSQYVFDQVQDAPSI